MSQKNSIPSPSNLESQVPPLELCQKIPPDKFNDSNLIWEMQNDDTWWEVVHRDQETGEPAFPAPNAIEIFLALAEIGADMPSLSMRNNNTWTADCWARIDPQDPRMYHVCIDDPNPATAAMKLWLHVYNGMAWQ